MASLECSSTEVADEGSRMQVDFSYVCLQVALPIEHMATLNTREALKPDRMPNSGFHVYNFIGTRIRGYNLMWNHNLESRAY